MRQLTKEMASYAWAVTSFSAQQLASLCMPSARGEEHPTSEAFREVTSCAEKQMRGLWRPVFHSGDTVQRWAIDLTFNLLALPLMMPGARGGPDCGSPPRRESR